MSDHLIIDIPQKNYRPGQEISGSVLWDMTQRTDRLVLSLGWWTEGKGTKDEAIIQSLSWDNPARIGKEIFRFALPMDIPYTFSGRLISVVWALQFSAEKTKVENSLEILTISPTDSEFDLTQNTYKSEGKSFSFRAHF